jgi:hypothetical protein
MLAALTIILLLLTGVATATPVKCYSTPPQGQGWVAWQTVDGKRCWYAGKRRIDKSLLRWDKPSIDVEPMPPPTEDELPTEAPPIRAQDEFEDRWSAQHDHRWSRDPLPINQWKLWP